MLKDGITYDTYQSLLSYGKNFHKRVDRGNYDRLMRHKYLKMCPFRKIFFRIGA